MNQSLNYENSITTARTIQVWTVFIEHAAKFQKFIMFNFSSVPKTQALLSFLVNFCKKIKYYNRVLL